MAVPKLAEQLAGIRAPGPLSEAFGAIDREIRGSFNYEDALIFTALLGAQRMGGDLLEIGVLNGKMSAVMALSLRAGETLHLSDLFEVELEGVNDYYRRHVSAADVEANVTRAVPGAQLRIHAGDSTKLGFADGAFRFIHVDGDHGYAGCLADLRNAWRWLAPGGLLAVDDYAHPDWPDVERATAAFLNETAADPVIDYNRRGAQGRKIILAKPA